ncbi:substrate-binding domain-containing protein [Streptomyces aurantiacus]|uniref:LysR substrate-binding domain-containing protein n=1 Tax=Streptomyces aurantiacus TaxID=47760 RepID=A0A7G1P431_9ACTN|nr:hypothetical protein GCM10017557_54120 [Streptomyces aurantiacus]
MRRRKLTGVRTAPTGARALARRRIRTAPLGIHTRPDHPLADGREVTWEELGRWPIITMRPGTVLHQWIRERLPDAEATVETTSARTVRTMVAQGAGAGLLARFDARQSVTGPVRVPLADADPVEVSLVQHADSQPSRSSVVVRRRGPPAGQRTCRRAGGRSAYVRPHAMAARGAAYEGVAFRGPDRAP